MTPNQDIYHVLCSQGVALTDPGVPRVDGRLTKTDRRAIWRRFAEHHLLRGTPSRMWIDQALTKVFGVEKRLSAHTADAAYDHVASCLSRPELWPWVLFERFGIEALATAKGTRGDLRWPRAVAEAGWSGRMVKAHRPDSVVDPEFGGFAANVERFGELAGIAATSWPDHLAAHRRAPGRRGVPLRPVRRGEGHHRAGALRRHRREPRQPETPQRPHARNSDRLPRSRPPRHQHMHAVADRAAEQEIRAAIEPQASIVLTFQASSACSFHNSAKSTKATENPAGMKVHVIGLDVFVDVVSALGGNPAPMRHDEACSTIKTGVIDGTENDRSCCQTSGHSESAEHLPTDDHPNLLERLGAPKATWNTPPSESQEVVRHAAQGADVEPVEMMQPCFLSGTHDASAAAAHLADFETIADTVTDPPFAPFMRSLLAAKLISGRLPPSGVGLAVCGERLALRFTSAKIRHRMEQIAMDGWQKLPQRLLGTEDTNFAAERPIDGLALAVAAQTRYVGAMSMDGAPIDVRGPLDPPSREGATRPDGKVAAPQSMGKVFRPTSRRTLRSRRSCWPPAARSKAALEATR